MGFILRPISLFTVVTLVIMKAEIHATADEVTQFEEVDFSIPELDPRNAFYRGRPQNVFGSHAEPTQRVEEIASTERFPSPSEFYEKYIKQYRPVVMRGAAKNSPAYELWTEEYLKEKYGDLTVRVEARSEDSPRIPSGIGGLGRDTIGNFLERYQTLDGYIISQLPVPMETDIAFPPFLTCGSLAKAVQEVHLFLSATGGKTLLHRDPYSSVHCVFNGTKQWLVINPVQKDQLYMSEESRFEFGGFSDIRVDDVDYGEHPKAKELEYAKVILRKGDCIYMPSGFTHQVRSRGYMNAAVSIWFSHYLDVDHSGCEESSNDFKPMSESQVLWRYSGHGELSQGHIDVHMLRTVMKTTADKTGKIWLGEFTTNFIQGTLNDEDIIINQRLQFTEILDPEKQGYISVEDLDALPLDVLKSLIEIIDPSDVSNREDFEYNHIDSDAIWGAITMLKGSGLSQAFSWKDFIKLYTIYVGGTEKVAREILSVLDPNESDAITGRMLIERGDEAFSKFSSGFKPDSTIEHLWYKQFAAVNLFEKYGVTHFDHPDEELLPKVEKELQQCSGSIDEDDREIVYVDDIDDTPVCGDGVEKSEQLTSEDEGKEDALYREQQEIDPETKKTEKEILPDDLHDEL